MRLLIFILMLGVSAASFSQGKKVTVNVSAFGVTDTASLSNRINMKVDTIYRVAGVDSIYFKINGTTYAIKDSTGGGGITQLTGDVTAGPGSGSQAATIASNAVTYAKMQQMVGLSVLGRSANSTGDMAAITSGTDHHALRQSGTSIGFGLLNAGAMNGTYSNGQVLQTNGSGVLSWVAPATGTVTGTGTSPQIAYWSGASSLTGSSSFSWDNTHKTIYFNNITPSAWGTYVGVIEANSSAFALGSTGTATTLSNIFYDGTNFKYKTSTAAGQEYLLNGDWVYRTAPSGTAGTTATLTDRMVIKSDGKIGMGTSTPGGQLEVSAAADGNIVARATANTGEGAIAVRNDQAASTALGSFSIYGSAYSITHYRNNVGFGSRQNLIFTSNNTTLSGGTNSLDFYTGGSNESERIVRMQEKKVHISKTGTALEANDAAVLELTGTTGGLIIPRMNATQAGAITPVNGLMLYVTNTDATFTAVGFWGYENGAWVKL